MTTRLILAAAFLLQLFIYTAPLEALRIRIGPRHDYPYYYHHNNYYYRTPNRYHNQRHNDNRYDNDDYDKNYHHKASSEIEEWEETDDEITVVELENGMEFEIEATGLGLEEGDSVNVFVKKMRSGKKLYKLLINGFEYKAYLMD